MGGLREASPLCIPAYAKRPGLDFGDMLIPIIFWRYSGVPFEIPAEEERVVVSYLCGNLFDWIPAFEQAPPRVINPFSAQPVNWR